MSTQGPPVRRRRPQPARVRRGPGTPVRGRPTRARLNAAAYEQRARSQLRRFRQGSALAVALTALLLLVAGITEETTGEELQQEPQAEVVAPLDPSVALEEAGGTLRELLLNAYGFLPRLALALVIFAIAMAAARIVRAVLQRTLGRWERTEAVSVLVAIAMYLGAIAIALSVLAGDARALLGSVGLVGLALSWALQTPIESFTGWLMNSLRGYYRVGDRIEVGEVFGDVYKIDVLTTTVWEAGGPGKAVSGAQPTGAMITFPNWEVLRSNIVNYSREFPYVWDEVTISIANESDLAHTARTFEAIAQEMVGDDMYAAATEYRDLLARARLAFDVDDRPRAFFSLADSWTNCTVRYLVAARKRRRLASDLIVALSNASNDPQHRDRIIPAYPRTEVQLRGSWDQPKT